MTNKPKTRAEEIAYDVGVKNGRDCQRQARGGDRVEAVVLPASGQELRGGGERFRAE